jgi:hypothetical protein
MSCSTSHSFVRSKFPSAGRCASPPAPETSPVRTTLFYRLFARCSLQYSKVLASTPVSTLPPHLPTPADQCPTALILSTSVNILPKASPSLPGHSNSNVFAVLNIEHIRSPRQFARTVCSFTTKNKHPTATTHEIHHLHDRVNTLFYLKNSFGRLRSYYGRYCS